MSDDEQTKTTADYEPPRGASKKGKWNDIAYTATARWLVLRKKEKPTAEIFSTAYVAEKQDQDRPVTFAFNGGPGGSSGYVHMGAMGPQRIDFPDDGSIPALPVRLVQNDECWLPFTDLVFIDPVGTGFSRVIEPKPASGDAKADDAHDPKQYYGVKADLDAMCEFISRWLSENNRWGSPVFLAGESYGGYRVGRLTRLLQEKGIGLSGSILMSPALEPAHLAAIFITGDYEVAPWVDLFPTMVATAVFHGRSRAFAKGAPLAEVLKEAELFATGDYGSFLMRGASMPPEERERVMARYADLIGLDQAYVTRAEGRVRLDQFQRELLRDQQKIVGRYDFTVTATDPFADRDVFQGAEPTLTGVGAAFTTAINRQLRTEIGVETDREYRLLELEVILAWKNDEATSYFQAAQGAVDDFRYGMAMNPGLKAFITHGWYDLITPYYASDRFRNLMRLDPGAADRLTVRHFDGGHMFYTWKKSRIAFRDAIAEFMAEAIRA